MSQLRQQNASHRCQIDCTNHDEVINALESKSKDLYYFWVNHTSLRETMNGYTNKTKIYSRFLEKKN